MNSPTVSASRTDPDSRPAAFLRVSDSACAAESPAVQMLESEMKRMPVPCAIDTRKNADMPSGFEVVIAGGTKGAGIDAVEWAVEAAKRGAGEILLTSMDRDGSRDGFDCALTRAVARAVPIPVIASGGVGKLEHFAEGIIEGEADAVLAASVFHFGELTVRQVKEYMRDQGIPVRL